MDVVCIGSKLFQDNIWHEQIYNQLCYRQNYDNCEFHKNLR
jgi:hypothetical protein